ncbi:vitamin K-dependent protein C-like [Eriocheir sinensis]|uniref:vitamin K-dependent protein C-like n=1 Tax=Eriocheir sinensis TaxID=95602 RepID=UPI0021C8C698|nr:vitamin K-dependent protein C-like [Eriocheir sinensis]XP_050738023.1 vitamin K-dependent protein C-like [Eriocheir sinensis]XP_050738024.1 vitamin K-dependent protein C-like [Eriocheir sinensis]
MKLWVMVTVVVGVLAAAEEVGAAKKRSRAHRKRHNRRKLHQQHHAAEGAAEARDGERGVTVRPWKGWRRWWETQSGDGRGRPYGHHQHLVRPRPLPHGSGSSGSDSHPLGGRGSRRLPNALINASPALGGFSQLGGGAAGVGGAAGQQDLATMDLGELAGGLYSEWTNWSRCSRRCRQRRRRSCRVPIVCGSAVQKEERTCSGGRCGRRPFHIIRPEEFSRQPPRNDMRVLLNFNAMFYTRWSRWSSCSRSCLTRRYRSCKYPLFCGGSVVHEEAYCYVEGSLCEKWYRRSRHPSSSRRRKVADVNTTPSPASPPRRPVEASLPQKCGVSNVTSSALDLRIIGGRMAQPGEWPWQVVILNRYHDAFCGGTLVAPRWVLTAAHCVKRKLYVRLGEHDLAVHEGPEIEYKVARSVVHPHYDPTTVDNDVALLLLPEPVEPGPHVSPACVPEQDAELPVGESCTIIGWGKERNTHFFGTDVLNEAEVPIIDNKMCEAVYEDYYITSNMFCAGYKRGRVDSCAGDSGGPLLCHRQGRWHIYGITSFGEGCGKKGKFGIYARVSNYRTWIQSVITTIHS